MTDILDPKFRFHERVKRLVDGGLTQEHAERVVTNVILTKEVSCEEDKNLSSSTETINELPE